MKKIGTMALAAILAASVAGSYPANAQDVEVNLINEEAVDATDYIEFTGVIKEVETNGDESRVTVEGDDEMLVILRINDDSLVFNSGTTNQVKKVDLKKGVTVSAYYDKNKPMILIYPTTVTPELVILKDDSVIGDVKVSKFDNEFLSLDGQLKLNIAENTVLVNQKGEAIDEADLLDKELVVFYSMTTRSLPPQTTPTKIMTLEFATEDLVVDEDIVIETTVPPNVLAIIEKDHYFVDGVKMIPLRKVAEELGYKVQSQPKVKGALVTKQNLSFTIKRGDEMYGFNKSLGKFEVAPYLKDMKTYVPEAFLNQLIQN